MAMKLPRNIRNGPVSRKWIAPTKPAYSQVILDRHAARVKVTRERIELMLKSV